MAAQIKEFVDEGLVNIIGGCCGTTPAHIAEYVRIVENGTSSKGFSSGIPAAFGIGDAGGVAPDQFYEYRGSV
jgi:hypothetical protein